MGKRISQQVELSHNYNRTGSRTNVGNGIGRGGCQRERQDKGQRRCGRGRKWATRQLSRLSDVTDYSTQLHGPAVCLAAFSWNTVLMGAYNVLLTDRNPSPLLSPSSTLCSHAIWFPHWAAKRLSNCNNTKCNWIHAANSKWSSLHWVSVVFCECVWVCCELAMCELAVCACASNNCKCNNKSHCTPMTNWSSCSSWTSWVLCDCRQRRNVFPATRRRVRPHNIPCRRSLEI